MSINLLVHSLFTKVLTAGNCRVTFLCASSLKNDSFVGPLNILPYHQETWKMISNTQLQLLQLSGQNNQLK